MSKKSNVKQNVPDNSTYSSITTATILRKTDTINYFLKILQSLLSYWRNYHEEESNFQSVNNLLKERTQNSLPDMTPFFLRQFVKGLLLI